MKEIKAGEYVRSKSGLIIKVKKFRLVEDEGTNEIWYQGESFLGAWESEVIKHSSKIIDLLHGGDFANGHKIAKITEDPITRKKRIVTEDWEEDTFAHDIRLIQIYNEEIETVVTEEQFNFMKYIVKE